MSRPGGSPRTRASMRREAQHEANATGQRVTLFWCGLEGRYRYVIGRPVRVGAVDRETIWPERRLCE